MRINKFRLVTYKKGTDLKCQIFNRLDPFLSTRTCSLNTGHHGCTQFLGREPPKNAVSPCTALLVQLAGLPELLKWNHGVSDD